MSTTTAIPNTGMDYSWNNPATYSVFIPGVSLVVHVVQNYRTISNMSQFAGWTGWGTNHTSQQLDDAMGRKLVHMCRWHSVGILTQMTASILAVNLLALPILQIIAVLAGIEAIMIGAKSATNITLRNLDQNGGSTRSEVARLLFDYRV